MVPYIPQNTDPITLFEARRKVGWPASWFGSDAAATFFDGKMIDIEFSIPTDQRLDGPQPERAWQFNVGLGVG